MSEQTTTEAAAAVLYDGKTVPVTSQKTANATAAESLYGADATAPTASAARLSDDPADRLYGDFVPLTNAIEVRADELWTKTGATEAQRQQMRDRFLGIAKSGVPQGIVTKLAEMHIDAELGGSRYRTEAEEQAEDEAFNKRRDEWNVEIRHRLTATYGSSRDAEALLTRAAKYVRQHPKLAAVLDEHGLGSRPELVEDICAHVFSTGYR